MPLPYKPTIFSMGTLLSVQTVFSFKSRASSAAPLSCIAKKESIIHLFFGIAAVGQAPGGNNEIATAAVGCRKITVAADGFV
ncbi:hypothetical protein TSUD_217980 [Trifolium subterraneum]|uniref:Uncharacterized protein n=1 Tax=Trifolium subterraneum TaxID=3900 RepID=A0A2Z6NH07_TRISU|nr:hypothetical protein TSUD_217980 [Trifolium subterraneum]